MIKNINKLQFYSEIFKINYFVNLIFIKYFYCQKLLREMTES